MRSSSNKIIFVSPLCWMKAAGHMTAASVIRLRMRKNAPQKRFGKLGNSTAQRAEAVFSDENNCPYSFYYTTNSGGMQIFSLDIEKNFPMCYNRRIVTKTRYRNAVFFQNSKEIPERERGGLWQIVMWGRSASAVIRNCRRTTTSSYVRSAAHRTTVPAGKRQDTD